MNTTATWIWYPGDFEVWLGNVFNNRRTQRGAMLPPFWKQDSHWPTVEFVRDVTLTEPETIDIVAEGQISVNLNGKPMAGNTLDLPAGTHHISIKVWNQATPPALFIDGRNIKTDSTWQALAHQASTPHRHHHAFSKKATHRLWPRDVWNAPFRSTAWQWPHQHLLR